MPTIVVTNAKGGVGKSTTSILLATEIAHAGNNVKIVDCDPNLTITRYFSVCAQNNNAPDRLELIRNQDKGTIIPTIKALDVDGGFVIIDLPGASSMLTSRSISRADLVLTPTKPQRIDAEIGMETRDIIKEEEEYLGKKIEHTFVLNEVSGVKSNEAKGVEAALVGQGVDLIHPSLMKRVPYSWLFSFGGDLRTIPDHVGKRKAQLEAAAFTEAVLDRLERIAQEGRDE